MDQCMGSVSDLHACLGFRCSKKVKKHYALNFCVWHGCRPSVCPYVTNVLWLTIRTYGKKTFYTNNSPSALNICMQNFGDLVQEEHFQIGGWMEGVTKCAFLTENWPNIWNGVRTAKVTNKLIITDRKCHIRSVRWDENYWPWMTSKVTDN